MSFHSLYHSIAKSEASATLLLTPALTYLCQLSAVCRWYACIRLHHPLLPWLTTTLYQTLPHSAGCALHPRLSHCDISSKSVTSVQPGVMSPAPLGLLCPAPLRALCTAPLGLLCPALVGGISTPFRTIRVNELSTWCNSSHNCMTKCIHQHFDNCANDSIQLWATE